jgi:hypothetical protein
VSSTFQPQVAVQCDVTVKADREALVARAMGVREPHAGRRIIFRQVPLLFCIT